MKLYVSKDYIREYGLYYVYIHIYDNKIIYVGKGSRARARDFANRNSEYKEYIENIGKENIKSYIIEESYDKELMIQLEMLVHELLLNEGYKLYSKPQFGTLGCLKGRIFSDETKSKLSKARKGKTHSEETKNKIGNSRRGKKSTLRKSVVQLALDNTFINEYDNIRELDKLGFHNSAIVMCCKGNRKTHKGYKWMYKEEYLLQINISNVA
ncbi:NUMOD3 motif (2 copies) [uncultured Clostridium sp.]|nr:NUMOD3 motif (2 copies) [uncultured Clostridium sp.]